MNEAINNVNDDAYSQKSDLKLQNFVMDFLFQVSNNLNFFRA